MSNECKNLLLTLQTLLELEIVCNTVGWSHPSGT